MIVYAESNFILEAATLQEEHEACLEILALAEAGAVRLVLPAFSLAEPIQTVQRRHVERAQLHERLTREMQLLSRSATYEDRVRQAADFVAMLDESRHEEERRLDDVLIRSATVGEIVPLDGDVLRRALELRTQRGLRHPDAIVLASVLGHLDSGADDDQRVFLQRDRKDFLTAEIKADLDARRCQLVGSFSAGLQRVRSRT